jgi:hypothetical protein
MPARYVIDEEGIIRAAEVNADYTIRPELSETVEQLRAVVGRSSEPSLGKETGIDEHGKL